MSDLLGGRYEALEVVGAGGQGQVLRARDTRHDRLVALKITTATDAAASEARALYDCRPHASLPLLRDDFTDGDRSVLVMDWVEGAPLAARPLDELCDLLDQIAAALDHLHAHTPPLIHGDVKPANILVTASGSAVLVDLGLVGSGVASGTPGFMAPEASRGVASPAVDIYSLGATVYSLLTGAPPRAGTAPGWRGLTEDEISRVETALGAALALDPEARPATASALIAALRGPAPRRTNLPVEVTSFVGRHGVVDQVRGALRSSRVVTLTGPGGIGKTRLALRSVAGDPSETWFAALASVRDPEQVASAVAEALGAPDEGASRLDALVAHVRDSTATIILDNCEQVLDGCARLVDAVTRACPGVTVLATSREPLGVWGEQIITVPPLEVGSEAAPLFISRARAQRASLTFDGSNESMVIDICRRLDGLPLAIELAAANMRTSSLDELAAKVARPLDLAGPRVADDRQRTLRGLIEWSWDLLDPADRSAFASLSVFAGSIGADEGAAVCGDRASMTRLADRSLLTLRADRFEMLDTIRAYASERLEDPILAREAHLAAFVDLAERAAPHLHGEHQSRWLDRLAADHENVREALGYATAVRDGGRALRLASAIGRYLEIRGHLREGRALLDGAIDVAEPDDALMGGALRQAGVFAHRLGDLMAARGRYEASLRIARSASDDAAVARCLHNLAVLDHGEGAHSRASKRWEEALALHTSLGDERGMADTLLSLGTLTTSRGDLPRARTLLTRSSELFERLGDRTGVADALSDLALVDEAADDLDAAYSHHEGALQIRRELDDRWGTVVSTANLASVARDRGDPASAASLFEEARTQLDDLGDQALTAYTECGLALTLSDLGRPDEVAELATRALRSRVALKDHRGTAECFEALAAVVPADRAARLLGAAEALRARTGMARTAAEGRRWARLTAEVEPQAEVEPDPIAAGLEAAGVTGWRVEP